MNKILPWIRRLPRRLLLAPLWVGCGMLLVRGIGTPIQSVLMMGGGMLFDPMAGPYAQEWQQWLLIDTILFTPWFTLGGFFFGATAWSARRQSA